MEYKLDSWLKTYQTEESISPADWDDLPQDCKIRLDNFARDEAVRRADQFAHEGFLDLNRQDAIRQLVDSMAQAWKLPGRKVRRIVEDIYDELPPQPGFEFEKLATKLFRRRDSYAWKEILDELNFEKEAKIIGLVIKSADVAMETAVSSSSFLNVLKSTYDHWTLVHPKEAVYEIIETADLTDESGMIVISDILPLIKRRGAMIWANSLNLELEVGIKDADGEDLVRILKRYALIVKREQVEKTTEVVDAEPKKEDVIEVVAEETEENIEEVEETAEIVEEVETEIVDSDVEEVEQEQETDDSELADLSEEDQEALNELIIEEESDDVAEVVDEYEYGESEEEPEVDSDEDEVEEEVVDEEVGESETVDEVIEEDAETEETADEEIPEEEPEDEEEIEEETAEEVEDVEIEVEEKEEQEDTNQKQKIKDVFAATTLEDKRDRFSSLRSGDLRDRIVKEMYKGDGTLLDVFLAKLSGAPDWNRAKQFIANEFFRCKLDLHSELGEEFFMQLKESLENRK